MSDNKQPLNNYSDEFKKDIATFLAQTKGTLEFQLTTGRSFQVPTLDKTFTTKMVYNATFCVPERDTIIDKYTKAMVDIACVEGYDNNGNPNYGRLMILAEQEGNFTLNISIPSQRRWAEFLLASNFCNWNKYRIEGKEICKLVDHVAASRARVLQMSNKQAAIIAAINMSDADKVDFAAAMNWNEKDPLEIITDKIATLADTDPEQFSGLITGNGVAIRSDLKKAVSKGIVSFSPQSSSLTWANGETFAVLDIATGETFLDAFTKWVSAHPKGNAQYEVLRKQLNKEVAAVAAKK